MKGLIPLVRVLRPSEKRLLHHHLSRVSNSEEKLRLQLFKLIDSGAVKTDAEAKQVLESKGGASAFSHLKRRLKDDILNVLLMQDTSKRFAQANRAAELDCRKKVAQSHLLLLRGAQIEGMRVLESALETADRYELLAERLQINHLLREKFLGRGTSTELTELNARIRKDMVRYEALLDVQEKSFVLASPEFAKKLKSRANDKKNLELIEELRKLYVKFKLARIGFWYYLAATEYHSARSNFQDVIELGLKFLRLVEKSPAVYSKTNMAGVNQTVGAAYLQTALFEQARVHFESSSKLFPKAGFNRLQSLEFLVKAETVLNEYDSALLHVNEALVHPRISVRENLLPQWLFLKASLEFLNGDAKQSFKTINQDIGFLVKQVDDWNVQFRFLEMLQLIEFQDEEWLEFKFNAARRFLNRHKELLTPRVQVELDIISVLLRNGLDFDGLSGKYILMIQDCLEAKDALGWRPTSPEIVRFDKWLAGKISNWEERVAQEGVMRDSSANSN